MRALLPMLALAACSGTTEDSGDVCADGVTGTLTPSRTTLARDESLTAQVVVDREGAGVTRVDIEGTPATRATNSTSIWTSGSFTWQALHDAHGDGPVELHATLWPAFCDTPVELTSTVTLDPECEAPTGALVGDDLEIEPSEKLTLTVDVAAAVGDTLAAAAVNGIPVTLANGHGTLELSYAALSSLLGGESDTDRTLDLALVADTNGCDPTPIDTLTVSVAGKAPEVETVPTIAVTTAFDDAGWFPTGTDIETWVAVTVADPLAVGASVALSATGPEGATGTFGSATLVLAEVNDVATATTTFSAADAGDYVLTATSGTVSAQRAIRFVDPPSYTTTLAADTPLGATGEAVTIFESVGGALSDCYASYPDSSVDIYRDLATDEFVEGTIDDASVYFTVTAHNTTTAKVQAWITCVDPFGRHDTWQFEVDGTPAE